MTSSNEDIFALLAICTGNSLVTGEIPAQRPVTRSFDVFFHLHLNQRLSKQSQGLWFETPPRPLWRHCNGSSRLWCGYISLYLGKTPNESIIRSSIHSIIFIGLWRTQHVESLNKAKMATILQTTFSKWFSWVKIAALLFKFHLSAFPCKGLINNIPINSVATNRRQAILGIIVTLFYWRIYAYASIILDELTCL